MKLIVLVGPPGSGKSTLAKQYESNGYCRVNQDTQGKHCFNIFAQAVSDKRNIIVDRMNFNKEQRSKFLSPAKSVGYETEIIILHESYAICESRCQLRDLHPTVKTSENARKALDFFFKNYERVDDLEADIVKRCYPEVLKPKAVICDLDGTLCNINHRLKWVRNERKNWHMFLAGIKDDKVNDWCANILHDVYWRQNKSIVLCSGRGDDFEAATKEWLKRHEIKYDQLSMRKAGDFRRDDIVKEILLDFEILTRYEPYFIIDDRQQVVDMWRRRGYTCLQCAKGDF